MTTCEPLRATEYGSAFCTSTRGPSTTAPSRVTRAPQSVKSPQRPQTTRYDVPVQIACR